MFTSTSGLKNVLSKLQVIFYTQHQLTWRDHSTHGSCSPLTTESSLRHVHTTNFWLKNALSKTTGHFYTHHQLTWRGHSTHGSCSPPTCHRVQLDITKYTSQVPMSSRVISSNLKGGGHISTEFLISCTISPPPT